MLNDHNDEPNNFGTNKIVLCEIMNFLTFNRLRKIVSSIRNRSVHGFYLVKSFETHLTFVSGDSLGYLHFWDVSNKKVFLKLKEHSNTVKCILKFNDDILITGSYDNTIVIWNLINFKKIHKLEGHKEFVRALIKINDFKFASGANDHTIKIWNIDGECLKTYYGSSCFVLCFLNLIDNLFMTGTGDGNIFVWDFEGNDKPINCLKGHTLPVWCLVKVNQSTFFSGSGDGIVKKWNFENDKNLEFKFDGNILKKPSNIINMLIIKKNILAIFFSNCEIIFFDYVKNKICGKLNSITQNSIQICSSELILNRFILCGYSNGNIDLFDIKNKDNHKFLTLNYYDLHSEGISKESNNNKSVRCIALMDVI